MDVLKNLLSSEHGFIGVVLIAGATILASLGHMTIDQWTSYSQIIFATYVGGHAAISVAGSIASRGTVAATTPVVVSSAVPTEVVK
jgi:hypothetical protein